LDSARIVDEKSDDESSDDERSESGHSDSAPLLDRDCDLERAVVVPCVTSVWESSDEEQDEVDPWVGSCQDRCEDRASEGESCGDNLNSVPDSSCSSGSFEECSACGGCGCGSTDVLLRCISHEEEASIVLKEPAAGVAVVDSDSVVFGEQFSAVVPHAVDRCTVEETTRTWVAGNGVDEDGVCDCCPVSRETESHPVKMQQFSEPVRASQSVVMKLTPSQFLLSASLKKLSQTGGRPPDLHGAGWPNDVLKPTREMFKDLAYALVLHQEVQSVQMLGNWSRCILLLAQVSEHVGSKDCREGVWMKPFLVVSASLRDKKQLRDPFATKVFVFLRMENSQEEEKTDVFGVAAHIRRDQEFATRTLVEAE
jgi:hypothetical protein